MWNSLPLDLNWRNGVLDSTESLWIAGPGAIQAVLGAMDLFGNFSTFGTGGPDEK